MNLNRSYNMGERDAMSGGRTLGMVIKEKDEELALFLEMRKREKEERERERDGTATDPADPMQELKGGAIPLYNKVLPSTTLVRKAGNDDFLNSDNDKNDYDWLLTPPGTPLFPSLEPQTKKSPVSRVGTPKSRQTALRSRLSNNPQDPPSRGNNNTSSNLSSRIINSSHSLTTTTTRRPSSSGGLTSSRPATPTGRTGLASHSTRPSRPSRPSTPTSRPILPSKSGPTRPAPAASKPVSRSTTPSRSTTVPTRSSTPSRSSSLPASKPVPVPVPSRSSTPTRRNPSGTNATGTSAAGRSAPPVLSRSISTGVTKTLSGNGPPAARAASPNVRSRPWKPSDMPGFSLDAPPNLRTSLPSDRPSSASRGRPGAPSARSASVDTGPQINPRMRRQSCSPSRGRAPNGVNAPTLTSSSSSSSRRAHHTNNNNTANPNSNSSPNPVAIGNKMVERVVHMRRLAPPKHETGHNSGVMGNKPALSPDGGSGFGRNLSKKSLDMALRHMDIRKSIPNNLRPLMTNIPASSVYSVRSGASGVGPPARSRQVSVSDSPLATSSNASSEPSVNNLICLEGNEMDEDFVQQPIRL